MRIAVAKETREGEHRVAIVPHLVAKLTALGYDVAVARGAGEDATFSDEEYVAAGATILNTADDVWETAGWVSPNPGGVGPMTRGMLLSNIVSMAEKAQQKVLR